MIHGLSANRCAPFLRLLASILFVLAGHLSFAQTVDCSNSANCSDPYCQFAANIEKGCNCFDGVDNDGDGKVDKADSNCATYYGLVFVGEDSDCSIVPPGANTPFDLVNAPITSDQNTADTQSKISVGDVDGDGIPDAIITSKWNQEIRVVATASGQADGTKPGQVKSDYKTTGQGAKIFSGTGGCSPKSLLFEHENLIADIDGDGKSEMFGVVSNRGGNPSTPPTCFFLVGFTYAPGTLQPLYNAIQIGTDRPGTFGIADMDGDGKAEIYLRDRIYAAETGKLLATGNGNWDLDITSGPVAVDVTGDNKMELVCGTKIYGIPDLSNRNPATPANLTLVADMNTITTNKAYVKLAVDPIEYGTDTHSMCSVADIDRDGNMDVVISGALNSVNGPTAVFYWNVAKGTVSHYVVTDPAYPNGWPWGTGRVNLGDANGDGKMDLTFIAGAYLHCLTTDASGNLVPLWPMPRTINDTRSGVLTVSIYDFNNDGDPEVVYRDSQELAVVDGATGQTKIWSAICQSHTYTEGPVIADVNGDGATDICVACNTSKSFDIGDPIQQQALGQFRLYYSSGNEWLPTRKVWNQPGYFVVNINDDLTLPFPQLAQNLVFGEGDCLNGLPGPQMPMNVFLNQVPFLSANGCPVYPAPDLSFIGDNPDQPGVDTNGDGVYTPAVEVFPPVCGDLGISVRFNIVNDGDLPITANIPVSFFIGDPTNPSITSDSLIHSTSLPINNLEVDNTYQSPLITFNGTGKPFRLYIVLNNDGTILPINPNGSVTNECRIDNNIYSAFIQPDPFTTKIEKIKDNFKCLNTAPDNGELRVRIYKAGVEVTDYSQYGFQWYTGTAANHTPIAGATNYNITGLAEGDYTAIVTNTAKGCVGVPVDTVVLREGNDPEVVINVISHQTVCNPPNGELQAQITGGNAGFTFEWFDIALNPLGISGPTANNLVAGNYLVRVSKDGCTKNSLPQTVDGPVVPDATASTLQNVVDCLNPQSGSVTATALFNGAAQDPANYSFDWYFYNNATATRGSVLPAIHGSGETRTGLPVGFYQVVVTDVVTQCVAVQTPITEITSQTVIPTATITELSPLTSCDPANPNGRLQAFVDIGGVIQDPSGYTFEWFKGDNTLPVNAHGSVSGVNNSIAEAVAGGGVFYTVKVTTANNCSDTEKRIITEDINLPVVTLMPTANGICDPALAATAYNGTVTASITFDGIAVTDFTNYQITWHDGALESDPAIPGETTTLLDERDGGFYTAVVERTDLGCASPPVTAEVVNALALPVIALDSVPSTNCVAVYNGSPISNGEAFVATVDNAPPNANHSFFWSDNGSPTDVDGRTTATLQNIQGGFVYTVDVTNKITGCRNSKAITVPDNSVVPVVSLTVAQPNSICDPALTIPSVEFNGRIEASFLTPSGNTADYKYTWRNATDGIALGDTPPLNNGQGVTQLFEFGGLNGDKDYTVVAENTVLGCTSGVAQVYLPNAVALPLIKTDSIASTNCVLNYGGNMIANGQAFVATIDGAAPTADYTFRWSDNGSTTDADGRTTQTITQIQGGFIYTVEVTNRLTGCRNTDPVPLADASVVPVVSLTVAQPNSICDPALTIPSVEFNGRIEASFLTPSGNISDYKYTWRNATDGVALGDTPPLNNGQGVTQLFEFGGLNGDKDYTVVAENTVLGCTSGVAQVYLPNAVALPLIKTDSIASTNCVLNYGGNMIANGQAFVATVDGAAPTADYTFRWSDNGSTTDADGRTTQTITQIQGGFIYTVEVTNRLTGCRNTDPVPLADASVVPVVSLTVAQPNSICNPALTIPSAEFNGRIEASFLTPSGNIADYKYTWRNATDGVALGDTPPLNNGQGVTQFYEFGGLNGDKDYTVVAENTVLGCTSGIAQVRLPNDFELPVIKTDSIPSTNCVINYNGTPVSNGQVSVSAVDAGAPFANYTFLWSDDGSTPTPTTANTPSVANVEGGFQYSVLVTSKATGCANTRIVNLPADPVRPVITVTKTLDNVNCTGTPTGELEAVISYRGIIQNNPGGVPALPAHYALTWSVAGSGDILSAQPAGTYTGTVVDETLGCTSDPDADIVLDAFEYPQVALVPTSQTSCDNTTPNGALQATLTVTTGTLEYQWYEEVGINGDPIGAPVLAQASGTVTSITNRASEDYTIRVRNELTGCESIRSAFIPNAITYPAITFQNVNPVTICSPTPNGSAEPSVTGLSALPTVNFDIYYVYTFDGGTYPTNPAVIKASADPKNIINGTGPINPGVNPPVYDDMAPGYLTAMIIDRNTKCESNPQTVQIINNTFDYSISINGTSAAGFCNGVGGGVSVTVEREDNPGADCTTCSYTWYKGLPSNSDINFFNNPPDMGPAPVQTLVWGGPGGPLGDKNLGLLDDGVTGALPGVGAGTYTLVVIDTDPLHQGCGNYFVEAIPFNNPPAITVTETDVTKCVAPFDGQIEVDVNGGGSTFGYIVNLYTGNNASGTLLSSTGLASPTPLNLTSAPTLEKGDYYVEVIDQDPANLPCPLASVHRLEQRAFGPQITLDQIVENTACDVTASPDGKIELTATADSQQNTVANPTDFMITAISPAPVGLAIPINIPDDGTSSGLLSGFGPQSYTITVTDANSGCVTDAVVNIPDQPVLPTIFTVASLNESYCAPLSNGRIEVTSVGVGAPEPPLNYEFEWYSSSDVSIPANRVYAAVGGGATTGEIFNGSKAGWSFGPSAGAGHGNRTYYVRGRRITGSGVGCFTQLEQKDVIDLHKTPDLTLTTFDNTSCLPGTGEGVLRAVTNIGSDPLDANVINGTYAYSWTPDPAGGNTSPANLVGRMVDFDITALTDGTYSVTTTNSVNGCSTTGTATIKTNPLPVTLLSYSKTDQLICNPDGSVNVTAIQIDATKTTANTVYSFNTPANLVANFDFKWFDSNNDGDGNPATYANTAIQSGGVDINDDVLTDDGALTAQPFANMGQGTYYVVATRKPGMSPGAGCTTVPVRVDVGRTVNDPVITALHPFANTSCDAGTVEGRIELTVQTASGVPAEAGSTYSYNWTQGDPIGNPGGAGNINNVANATATSLVTLPQGYVTPPAIGPAFKDDTYTITVRNDYSGCSVTGQAVITRQKFPVTLISFTKQDQLICGPDGRITVSQVTIDGSTSNLPVFNYSTPADLAANFDFAWFDSNNDGDNDPNTFSTSGATLQSGGAPITDVVLSEDAAETTQPFVNMGVGSYYVLATRKPGMSPGAGCSTLPVRVNIEDKHINPVITAIEPFANTSCDAAVVEGRIELTVDTNSGVPAEAGSTYTYSWVQADPVGNPGGSGNMNNVANATATSLVTIPQGYAAPPAVGPALKDDTYTITVRNDYSSCTTTGQVVITPQRYPITLISFTKQDQLICGPDGRITVTQVTIDGSTSNLPLFNYSTPADLATNFDFAWFDSNNDGDNDPNTFSTSGATLQSGGAPITDVVLSEDPAETTQPFANMGLGSYYVLATRKPGMTPGAGCSTLPVRVNIEDKHINPVITAIQPFANTSCDASIVEGRIELTVDTDSGVPAEAGSTYSYTWVQSNPADNPGGAGNIDNVANATATSLLTIPQGYAAPPAIGPALKDDTYTITVKNDYSNCITTGQAVITPQRYPITLISFTKQDQLICDPDGRITVTGVTIDGRTSNLPVYNFTTTADLRTNFDFAWFDSNNDGDNNAATYDVTLPLTDGINPLADVVLSEDIAETIQPYAAMGAGSYYVVAKRKPGLTPGAGCLTEPVRVNIEDLHSDPTASFAFTPNSSCDPMDPNGQLIATAQERDGSTDAYTFAWTLNTDPLPGVTTQTGVSPISQLDNAYEGDYVLEVTNTTTGCTFTSGLTVNLDLNVSLPNIINVDTTDPTNCLGNGSAEVTSISVGGGPPVTGAVLGTGFQYEWYNDDFVPGNLLANTAPLLPALTAGKYYVLVQDLLTDCKSAPTEVVIDDDDIVYPLITIRQTALQISCITTSGTAGLEATADLGQTDANPNYSFTWFNNLDATAPSFASTSAITGLVDGDYSVMVTNSATGCSSQDIYIIKDDSETFMPQLSLNTEGRVDCLNPDGTLLAREVGQNQSNGYPFPINYTTEYYIGENADVSQPGIVMTNVPGFNRNWLERNLDVGSYTVKITDNNTGCSVFKVDAVDDLRTPPVIAIMEDNPLINCDPAIANGQLSATADGGRVGGYQFNWFSGVSATGAVVSNNNKLIGISLGDFTVRVTNETTHCFADATSGVTDGRLAPPTPTAVLVFDRTRCDYPDGWVTANVGGITFNYTFDWYDGTAVKTAPDFAGVNYQHRDIGVYTVTAMDQVTGCLSAPTSVEVKDLRVIPEVIVNTTPSYCEELPGAVGGNGTAQIQLNPADVVSDEVSWSPEGDATVIGIGSYLNNVLPGFYQANVITSQGCPASGVGEVKTEVFSYNLVSTNGDRKNDDFRIDCITQFPNNNVKIFNRSGVLVYEADGYDNNDVVFQGIGKRGIYTIGNELPVGTYFYIIDKRDGSKPKTGYLELVR